MRIHYALLSNNLTGDPDDYMAKVYPTQDILRICAAVLLNLWQWFSCPPP